MRPLEIVISAFGPYAEEVKLNMEQLGKNGLYLITGDTGAGKTTIFDAVIYALYGEASGSIRTADMFRSKYAASDTPTFVSLRFLMRDEEYYVKRNPEYMRPSKRGKDKMTKETAGAELIMPNGKVISGVAAVNGTIIDVIGLNKSQFSQIAMIAQGDFLKLLLADTKQRISIFREIFHTKPYLNLQDKLKEMTSDLNAELSDAKKLLLNCISDVFCDEVGENFVMLENIKSDTGLGTLSETVLLIDRIIDEDNEKLSGVSQLIDSLDKRLTQNNQLLGKYEQLYKYETELRKLKTLLPEFERNYTFAQADYTKEKENEPLREQISADIQSNTADLRKYDEYEEKLKENSSLNKKLEAMQNELQLKKKSFTENEKRLKDYNDEMHSLKGCVSEYEQSKAQITRLMEHRQLTEELEVLAKSDKEAINSYYKALRDYEKANKEYEMSRAEYVVYERRYFDGQAGILAQGLTKDKPCPVCGSLHHPNPAISKDDMLTKEELDKYKEAVDIKWNECSKLSSLAGAKKGTSDSTHRNLIERAAAVLNISKEVLSRSDASVNPSLEETIEETKMLDVKISEAVQKLAAELDDCRGKYLLLEKNIARLNQLEELVPKLEQLKKESDAEISELEKGVVAKKVYLENSSQALEEIRNNLSFENRSCAKRHIEQLRQKKDILDRQLLEATQRLEAARLEYEKTRQQISFLETTINEEKSSEYDADGLRQAIEELTVEKKEVMSEKKQLDLRLAANTRAVASIREISAGMQEKESRLQWVKALSDTANGLILGKERIMLETYVQMSFFDKVIRKANLRFMTMTMGQYELVRSSNSGNLRSQSGLELDVIDHYNATTRSVKSLSGGESFKASLSLALGLSDEVQSQAGGIRIDTMFVDEGFGSLDEESLRQAIDALTGLADSNRLVGIISHVNELKDKIDKQIIVTKDRSGGSHAFCRC